MKPLHLAPFTFHQKNNLVPANKLALIRYKTIDACLTNRYRKWTLDDLIEAVSEAIYEYEGIDSGVSKRTIQLDLQNMRGDKLGYNAPIVVTERKYYTYSDNDYSITNTPLSPNDVEKLNDVVRILKQFKGFTYFNELAAMVAKLEAKITLNQDNQVSYIDFDKNELLKGQEYIEPLHDAIRKKRSIEMRYRSFRSRDTQSFLLYPYLLKEYNNRWFVIGSNEQLKNVSTLALDRIEGMELSDAPFEVMPALPNVHGFFDDVIGISKTMSQTPIHVEIRIVKDQWHYLRTKPMHSSQTVVREEEKHIVFSVDVIWNYELEREIISLGERAEVLSPGRLKRKIRTRMRRMLEMYEKGD